jgi:hypothetical protein
MRKPEPKKKPVQKLRERILKIRNDPRAMNTVRNAVIILLLCSAAVLAAHSGLFGLSSRNSAQASSGQTGGKSQSAAGSAAIKAAGPYVIAVTDDSGSHCGLMYDGAALVQAYDGLSAYLGEALGSAGDPEKVDEKEWRQALGSVGVYFDFGYDEPLSLLASGLNVSMTSGAGGHSAARFCLRADGDAAELYYLRSKDGGYYKCTTAVSSDTMTSKLGAFTPNGASFLFETDYDYDLVDRYFLLPQGQAAIHSVTAKNPVGTDFDAATLTALFSMNGYLASHYPESDGTEVYVESGSTLRIGTDGTVTYRNTDAASSGGDGDAALKTAVARAGQIVSATVGSAGGIAAVGLDSVEYSQTDGAYVVRYCYEINGMPVSLGAEDAAEITVTGGKVTGAVLNFREYSYSGEDDAPLPALQAMAVVQAKGGGMPLLCYVDDGSTVSAGWIVVK